MSTNLQSLLDACNAWIRDVETDEQLIESAAYNLVGMMLQNELWRVDPRLNELFSLLAEAELARETSYAQPIGHWRQDVADRLKCEEWARIVAEVRRLEALA